MDPHSRLRGLGGGGGGNAAPLPCTSCGGSCAPPPPSILLPNAGQENGGSWNSSALSSSVSSPDSHVQQHHHGDANPYWTAVFDYEAAADEELTLRRGDLLEVLSKDSKVGRHRDGPKTDHQHKSPTWGLAQDHWCIIVLLLGAIVYAVSYSLLIGC